MRNLFRKEPSYRKLPAQARSSAGSTDTAADGLWARCENERCRELLYVREFENNLKVCHKCEHHARLTAHERIAQLVDEGSFREVDANLDPSDPLGFVADGKSYRDKLREDQEKTGLREAAVAGSATIGRYPVEIVVMDFGFMGGTLATVGGEKIARAAERATRASSALVTVSVGGGARMQEGILSLMQMAKTVAALSVLARGGEPHISILTDPTLGGITASYAGVGDVIIAEQGALIGFAGPRVIEQITKQKLPPDAQRAAFLLEHGMADMVLHRREIRPVLARLLKLYDGARSVRTGGDRVNGAAGGVI